MKRNYHGDAPALAIHKAQSILRRLAGELALYSGEEAIYRKSPARLKALTKKLAAELIFAEIALDDKRHRCAVCNEAMPGEVTQ